MKRYTLTLWRDDMGTFTQPGCTSKEDALWHINSARQHDGLEPLTLEELDEMFFYPTNSANARMTLEKSD